MSNLAQGTPVQPYGQAGRKVTLPVKATTQVYEGAMVSQPSGACAPATAGNSTAPVKGVAEHDQLGGAADGDARISLMTDQIFIFPAGVAAPTDATVYGSPLYAETDHTVGTSSSSGTLPVAGEFRGLEDDGRVRVYIGATAARTAIDPGALTFAAVAGTANQTLEAVADPADSPATADALRDDLVANALPQIRNNFADLASQLNAIRTALVNAGLLG